MKKLLILIVSIFVLAGLFSHWLGAPTNTDLSIECTQQGKNPGDVISLKSTDYTCPRPTATPAVIYKYLVETNQSLCDAPDKFSLPTNNKWLEMNVLSPANSWSFDGGSWIYTFEPYNASLIYGSTIVEFVDGFRYPGFGVYKLYLFEGGSQTISDYGSGYYHIHFTKLELSCN